MQVTKGTWRMREQCVPGSLSSSHALEPGNEATMSLVYRARPILSLAQLPASERIGLAR